MSVRKKSKSKNKSVKRTKTVKKTHKKTRAGRNVVGKTANKLKGSIRCITKRHAASSKRNKTSSSMKVLHKPNKHGGNSTYSGSLDTPYPEQRLASGIYDMTRLDTIIAFSDLEGGAPFNNNLDHENEHPKRYQSLVDSKIRVDSNGILNDISTDTGLIFLGDLIDNERYSIRSLLAYTDLKSKHPAKVVFTVGNRDINKLRMADEAYIEDNSGNPVDFNRVCNTFTFHDLVTEVQNNWSNENQHGIYDHRESNVSSMVGTTIHESFVSHLDGHHTPDVDENHGVRYNYKWIHGINKEFEYPRNNKESNSLEYPTKIMSCIPEWTYIKDWDDLQKMRAAWDFSLWLKTFGIQSIDHMVKELRELYLISETDDNVYNSIAFLLFNMLMSRSWTLDDPNNNPLSKYNGLYIKYLKCCDLCAIVKLSGSTFVLASHAGFPDKVSSVPCVNETSSSTPTSVNNEEEEEAIQKLLGDVSLFWNMCLDKINVKEKVKMMRLDPFYIYLMYISTKSGKWTHENFVFDASSSFIFPGNSFKSPFDRTQLDKSKSTFGVNPSDESKSTYDVTPDDESKTPERTWFDKFIEETGMKDVSSMNFKDIFGSSSQSTVYHLYGHQPVGGLLPMVSKSDETWHIDMDVSKIEGAANKTSYALLVLTKTRSGTYTGSIVGRALLSNPMNTYVYTNQNPIKEFENGFITYDIDLGSINTDGVNEDAKTFTGQYMKSTVFGNIAYHSHDTEEQIIKITYLGFERGKNRYRIELDQEANE